ncbi:MAG: single-stranded DNA-binding protein [Leptolinea sp.]|jgi:single-strand DNA-binding protein|nr:single-stranded DNA-binding protein [Leptolinea sp.]
MFQTIIIAGNLGKDPEMRYTPSGQAVTSFNVATNRNYTDANGQQVKETIWFRVSVWGKQAESTHNYLKKGSKVIVEGRLIADPATGGPRIYKRSDGSSGASFEITASNVRFLSSRTESGEQGAGAEEVESGSSAEDDLPF